MKKQEIKKFSFDIKINDIFLTDFSVENIKSSLESKLFVFEFLMNFRIEPSEKLIIVNLSTKVFSDKSKELYLAKMDSQGIFEVVNLDKVIDEHNGVPNMLLINFAGVMVSTTRGFMKLKSEKTIINGAIIPFVDPSSFFKE